MVISVVFSMLRLTILLSIRVRDFGREERGGGHCLLNTLHFVWDVADHACRNGIITLLNSTRTCNSHI